LQVAPLKGCCTYLPFMLEHERYFLFCNYLYSLYLIYGI